MLKKIVVKFNIVNILSIPLLLFRIFPIKSNKICFINFSGKDYGDSPKYISEKLHELDSNLDLVWLVKNVRNSSAPNYIRLVKYFSLRYFYELATSRIWINNSRFDQFVIKRKNQYYVQTWHGGLAFKKIEYDADEKLSDYYHKVMKHDNKLMDCMISNGKFCTELYRRGFKYNGDILEFGTPRNDVLINDKMEINQKVRNFFKISDDDMILLYAPTFRLDYSKNPYDIDFSRLRVALEKSTKKKWHIFIKLHPRITNSSELLNLDDYSKDISFYPDIQELICASNLVITDYSSTMFESMIADIPVIIYANDIDNYIDERGFYFNFNELPFKLSKNNEELEKIIMENELDLMKGNYLSFEKRVGLIEKGDSCKKICNYLIKNVLNK